MSNLEIAPENRFSMPRPASILITQILLLISFVPITLGLGFVWVSMLIQDPLSFLSVRGVLFFSTAFVLMTVFLIYGFRGLKYGRRNGYWIGLLFLVLLNVSGIYKLTLTIQSFLSAGTSQSRRLAGPLLYLDLTIQIAILLFCLVLLLKVAFGKKERMFFFGSPKSPSSDLDGLSNPRLHDNSIKDKHTDVTISKRV
ncbi:MAG TPA: hypothetical protein VGQ41_13415 [Pyrinomonadaceae bacterium]|jgi:hypothetical protein|nr:hypothetical protein [Pyrinomonadaceae bacterium]